MIDLYNGDCINVMRKLIDKDIKVDAIICDPPYGTTACKWDTVIPFNDMWQCLNALIKDTGAIVLFGSEPFSTHLRMSNIDMYKYDLYWVKNKVTGFTHAKNKPLKNIELISIFSKGVTVHESQSNNRMTYNPQGITPINKKMYNTHSKFGTINGKRPSHKKSYLQEYTNYPKMVIEFNHETGVHPTQKPVELMEYLIKTYSNTGDTILDFTMGSGSTGIACLNTNRNFIGIELDEKYFNIASDRINSHIIPQSRKNRKKLF